MRDDVLEGSVFLPESVWDHAQLYESELAIKSKSAFVCPDDGIELQNPESEFFCPTHGVSDKCFPDVVSSPV